MTSKTFTIRPRSIGHELTIKAWGLKEAVENFTNLLGLMHVIVAAKADDNGVPYIHFKIGTDREFYAFEEQV